MIDALTSHLWQSTLFAVGAALLTLAFRVNRAQVRYWMWMGASFKFLIPFALLTSLGSHIQVWAPVVHELAAATPIFPSSATDLFGQSLFPSGSPQLPPSRTSAPGMDFAILGMWLFGLTSLTLIRLRKWWRIQLLVRASSPTNIAAPIEIRSSPGSLEPGIVGLIRPILLLPEGIRARLSSAEMDAILAHELCHVRRRDNLLACLHMIVETMFWFHPLVWFIGARMLEERERACDEEVVSRGNLPDVYAQAILNVCKLYVASPLVCVSGVTGATLKRRIEAIMTNRIGENLNRAKKVLLASAVVSVLAGPLAIGVFHGGAARLSATPFAPQPQAISFEVASVRVSTEPAKDLMFCISGPCAYGERFSVAGSRVNIRFMSLSNLIATAYSIKPNQLSGPDWMQSQKFDVEAKTPEGSSANQVPEMLKALLAERFKLVIHRDRKEQAVFALVVGKDGMKLQKAGAEADASIPEAPGDQPVYTLKGAARQLENGDILVTNSEFGPMHGGRGPDGGMKWEYSKLTMPGLAALLAPHVDRPVVDMTGLSGSYHLVFQNQRIQEGATSGRKDGGPPQESPDTGVARPEDAFGEGLIAAIKRAGIKLEARRAAVEIVVVDHLEKTPTGN